MTRARLSDGLRAGVPVGAAGILIGVSFGVLAQPVMGSVAPIVMSAFLFAGSAQFGSLAVLAAGGGALPAIVAGLLLNARFLPMGIAYAPVARGLAGAAGTGGPGGHRRLLGDGQPGRWRASTATSWSARRWCSTSAGSRAPRSGSRSATRSAIRRISGSTPCSPRSSSRLLVPELRNRTYVGVAVAAAALTLVLIPLTPPGVPVLAACSIALVGLWRR